MKKIKSRKQRAHQKKILRWCVYFIFMLVGLGQIGNVEAGMNDSTIEKNRVDGVYAVSTSNGENRLFYLNMYRMNGRVAYCIELGVDITTTIYHSTENFSVSYLSSEQIEYIRSISYFGYGYAGHDDKRYYMAAQEIIWEYLGGGKVEIVWTSQLSVNGLRINVESYKEEILSARDNYYNRVSFNWIDGQSYSVGSVIELVDGAKVLSDYEVISSGHSEVLIDGNTLTIEVSRDYLGMETIILQKKEYYDYDSLLYYYDDSQMLISNGNFKDLPRQLYFRITGETLNVQVVDKMTGEGKALGQASLEGAKYELYDENHELVGEYVTDKDRRFQVNNLVYGTYYVKQIEASVGYLMNSEEVMVEVSQSGMTLVLEQEVIGNTLEIRKVYGSNGQYYPEENILFQIYDCNGMIYEEVKTNVEGSALIWLPYGEYEFRQSNTTLGYLKVDDFKVVVQEQKEDKVYYYLVNEMIQSKVRIHSYDQDSGKVIQKNGFGYRLKRKGEDEYLEFAGESVFYTDEDGNLVLPILCSYGDYILEQVEVPTGVLINSKPIEFTIGEQTEFVMVEQELFVDVDIYNSFIVGRVNVLWNQEIFYSDINEYGYEKVPIVNEKLVLVASEDIVVNGEILYQENDEVITLSTNEEGKVSFDDLPLGSYCLLSQLNDKKECFSLSSLSNEKAIIEKEIEMLIELFKSNIVIQNKDNYGEDMEGVVVEVYDEENILIYTGVTNQQGVIEIKNLMDGNYCVNQKKVPSGYQILMEQQCFSLKGNQVMELINKRIEKKSIWVPNTFSEKIGFWGIINIFLLIGMIVFVYKKIFCSS